MHDTEKNSLTALFFRTARKLHGIGGPEYSQQRILRILCRRDEVRLKEIQQELQIKAGSLSELAAKLEKKGYIVKEKSRTDRRRTILRITEQGRGHARMFEETKDERLFAALSPEERETMKALLQKVLSELEDAE